MGEPQIQITEGKLEFQDYLDMVRLVNKRDWYMICGFFSLAIVINIITKDISSVITILILWGGYELYLRRKSKRAFQSSKHYQIERTTYITARGIEFATVDGSFHSITKWDEFCEVRENEKLFYLMSSSSGYGHFFYKKNFTPEALAQFENIIKNMLDSKLFVKVNPLKYIGIGVLIHIAFICLSAAVDHLLQ